MQPAGALDPDPLLQRYLDFVRHEKRLAARSVSLYRENLLLLQALSTESAIPLLQVQTAHVRRWIAALHARGRSARGLALVLSSWRGFYRW